MLKRIRELFKKKEEEKEVEFFELEEWLTSVVLTQVQPEVAEYNMQLDKLEPALKQLEDVDINKQKVEDKLKVMVRGNRPAYVTAVRNFAHNVKLPDKLAARTLDLFCDKFDNKLKDFTRRTIRNYSVMKTIIGKELDAVAVCISGMEKAVKRIKDRISKLKEIEKVQIKLREIYSYLEEKNQKLKKLEDERLRLMQKERLMQEDIAALRKGEEFNEIEQLKIEKQDLETKMLRERNEFNAKLAVLQRPLRKLSKLDVLKKIEGYVTQPFNTLVKDNELEINTMIGSLKDSIKRGKIDIKSTASVSAVLKELTPASIRKVKGDYIKSTQRLAEVESAIRKNKFEAKEKKLIADFKELETKLAHVNSEIDRLRERKLSQEIPLVEEELHKIAGHKVRLKNAPVD